MQMAAYIMVHARMEVAITAVSVQMDTLELIVISCQIFAFKINVQ